MYASVTSYTLQGIYGVQVKVEVDVANGLPNFHLVGLPSTSVRESKDRVRSAIQNSGFTFPLGRITVNLAPADLRKEGPSLDLPICIGILIASGQLKPDVCEGCSFLGEIALDGSLLPVRGALSLVLGAVQSLSHQVFVPQSNVQHIPFLSKVNIVPVTTLKQCVEILQGNLRPVPDLPSPEKIPCVQLESFPSIDLIKGQWQAKRALVVAAAGGHNLLFSGSPGTGKTMLCKSLARLLPPLNEREITNLMRIYGSLSLDSIEIVSHQSRPFRNPHHSITPIGLLGGGSTIRPGEITFAHHGVLFLDELLEFPRSLLDLLREPIEKRTFPITRSSHHVILPASFQLVAACNPCPCGFWGDPGFKSCTCTVHARAAYQSRASGPFLDRFDIRIYVPPINQNEAGVNTLTDLTEESARTAIQQAWQRQLVRNGIDEVTGETLKNARLTGVKIEACEMTDQAVEFLVRLFEKNLLSGRGREAIVRVAQTLADLAASPKIDSSHLAEAYQLRQDLFTNAIQV